MRLLFAEDSMSLSRAVTAVLQKNRYEVDAVYDGQSALEKLRSRAYNAVILDIMMPKLDGLEVLRAARGEGIAVPILMLTAKSEVADKVRGLDDGANDYLTKPFDMQELLARLRVLTRDKQSAPGSTLRVGNVTLDRTTFELSCGGTSFRLSNMEFRLMETLMASPRRVFSSEWLLEHVWGYDTDAEINVVWVYISYLRKKLKALNANMRIVANRSIGYSMEIMEDD